MFDAENKNKTVPDFEDSVPVYGSPFERENWTGPDMFRRPLRLPEEMGNMTVVSQLGSGSRGQVYHVQEIRNYAAKMIPWKHDGDRARARKEYDTARLFADCPQVITYLSIHEEEEEEGTVILQELGEEWFQYYRLPGHVCTLKVALEGVRDLALALSAIHKAGYLHYDVNPNNVLVVDGRVKLCDFSHTWSMEIGKHYRHTVGTRHFMAPEIFRKESCTGTEDLYSLGITMYAMLTGGMAPYESFEGSLAFRGQEEHEERDKDDRLPRAFMHPDILAIVEKATAWESADRYQTAEEFIQAIDDVMAAHPELLQEEVPGYRMPGMFGGQTVPFWGPTDYESSRLYT